MLLLFSQSRNRNFDCLQAQTKGVRVVVVVVVVDDTFCLCVVVLFFYLEATFSLYALATIIILLLEISELTLASIIQVK